MPIALLIIIVTVSTFAFVALIVVLLLGFSREAGFHDLVGFFHRRGSPSSEYEAKITISLLIITVSTTVSTFCLVGLIAVLLLGFCQKATFDDVVGVYRAQYRFGTEELLLARDGTYVQSLFISGQTALTINKGRWKFWKEEPMVDLFDPMHVMGDFGKLDPSYWKVTPGSQWGFEVYKSFGRVSLPIAPDLGYFFKKIR